MLSRSVTFAILVSLCCRAWAVEQLTTPRSMGRGDAMRGLATGSAGIHLNPSGLVMQRNYIAELAYDFHGADSIKYLDISLADSVTSKLAAGAFFRYLNADGDRTGWEAGVAIAAPLAEFLSLGVTPKYHSVGRPTVMGAPPTGGKADGFTMDIGATARIFELFSIGVVGGNLVEQDSVEAPRTFALGVAIDLFSLVQVGFDTVFDFDTLRVLGLPGGTSERYHVGGEVLLGNHLALRAGYIRDGTRDANLVAYGASVIIPQLALDFGGRTQIDGSTVFGVAARLFLQ